jgi:cbb3-type cytochrome oxidase maturation protein
MEVVFGLVGVSVLLLLVIAAVLLWAVRSGQFEDMEGPAWRVVMDDDRPPAAEDPGPAAPHPGAEDAPPRARGPEARDRP